MRNIVLWFAASPGACKVAEAYLQDEVLAKALFAATLCIATSVQHELAIERTGYENVASEMEKSVRDYMKQKWVEDGAQRQKTLDTLRVDTMGTTVLLLWHMHRLPSYGEPEPEACKVSGATSRPINRPARPGPL
jgi:hypothetical protein